MFPFILDFDSVIHTFGGEDNNDDFVNVIFNYQLTNFSVKQKICLTVTVILLLLLAILGNMATFFANSRKKFRPFFRSCLYSLAISDLLTAIFSSLTYILDFTSEYIQEWKLGPIMCDIVPVITTGSLLISSVNLVGIALDRYMAVAKSLETPLKFGNNFYSVLMIIAWIVAFAIASPMASFYIYVDVHIAYEVNGNVTVNPISIGMCACKKEDNTYYFLVVMSIIFLPTLIAFVWLNTIVAQKLWLRRNLLMNPSALKQCTDETKSTCCCGSDIGKICICTSDRSSVKPISSRNREVKHIRIFNILIALIATFLFLRLPTWIFMIMKMYGSYTTEADWIIQYIFGILTLISCVLNPLLYTFLSETLQIVELTYSNLKKCIITCFKCCKSKENIGENQ